MSTIPASYPVRADQPPSAWAHLPAGIAMVGTGLGLAMMRVEVIDVIRQYLSPSLLWIACYSIIPGALAVAAGVSLVIRASKSQPYLDGGDFLCEGTFAGGAVFLACVLALIPVSHALKNTGWAGYRYAADMHTLKKISRDIIEQGGSPSHDRNKALFETISNPDPGKASSHSAWGRDIVTGDDFGILVQSLRMVGYIDLDRLNQYRSQGWMSLRDRTRWERHAQDHPVDTKANLATQQSWAMAAGHRSLRMGWRIGS